MKTSNVLLLTADQPTKYSNYSYSLECLDVILSQFNAIKTTFVVAQQPRYHIPDTMAIENIGGHVTDMWIDDDKLYANINTFAIEKGKFIDAMSENMAYFYCVLMGCIDIDRCIVPESITFVGLNLGIIPPTLKE